MAADFAGETARLYARYRRDPDAPLLPHCAGAVVVDPEPGMLR